MNKRRVLVLCTGNSCRSQMAEGLIRHFLGERWEAYSAGTRPAGYVHPLAVQVMRELGVDISGQRSKSVDEVRDTAFDLVVTVCDEAARECPVWPGGGQQVHVGFPDPAGATGSETERLEVYRRVRDAIRQHLLPLLEQFEKTGQVAGEVIGGLAEE